MTANGEDIDLYQLKPPPIRIVYIGRYEEQEARIQFGLSFEEYDALPGTPTWITEQTPQLSKAHVVAFVRTKNRIQAVIEEAQERNRK